MFDRGKPATNPHHLWFKRVLKVKPAENSELTPKKRRRSIHSKHASVPSACTDHNTARLDLKSVERRQKKQTHSLLTSSYAYFFISGITSTTLLGSRVSQYV